MILDDSSPRYLPHTRQREVLAMGLSPLAGSDWVEVDSSLPRFHAHKQRLRAERSSAVYRWLEESLPAQEELAARFLAYLVSAHADSYHREDGSIRCSAGGFSVPWPPAAGELLWALSLLVADDLVIMQPGSDGYRLTAASLCSPSHWRLAEKLGRPLRAIHDPIPGVHEALSPRIDRFFDHLRPGHPVQRYNWSVQADPDLFHAGRSSGEVPADAELFYRVERQTLTRLPRSGAVVFTIRVFLHPLAALRHRDGALRALREAVAATPPALARYKGFDALDAALRRYGLS